MDQFFQTFNDFLDSYPAILIIPVLAGGILAAWVVDKLFTHLLIKLTVKTKNTIDDKIMVQLHRPLQLAVLLLVVVLSLHSFLESHPWRDNLTKIGYSLLIILMVMVVLRTSRLFFRGILDHGRSEAGFGQMMTIADNVVMAGVLLIGGWWLFGLWRVDVTPLLASAGLITAAVALAAKDTLANLFGGISILMDRPFKIGDYIDLESGERGSVVRIGIRSTRILTRDDILISLPNSYLASAKVINESGQVDRYRFRAKVGVAYESDLDVVERALMDALSGIPEVLKHPEPRVRLRSFADSSIEYELLAWILFPADRGRILHQVYRNIFRIFRERNITIPYAQVVYHRAEDTRGECPPLEDNLSDAKKEVIDSD